MKIKKLISMFLSALVLFSCMGIMTASAEATYYDFYTSVGSTFTPNTNAAIAGVSWNNGTTPVNTSLMGRRILTGTNAENKPVTGLVNIGVQKWTSYQNNEGKATGTNIAASSSTDTDTWRYTTADDTNFALYKKDPKNTKNTVVTYVGGDHKGTIKYHLATAPAAANDTSVEFKVLVDKVMDTADVYTIQLQNADGSVSDSLTIGKGTDALTLSLNGTALNTSTALSVDTWADMKLVLRKNTGKVHLFINGSEVLSANSNHDTSVALSALAVKGESSTAAREFPLYIDDVRVTDLTTTDYIYYDDFTGAETFQINKTEETELISFSETVDLVDAAGIASGFTAPITGTMTVDTSILKSYVTEMEIPGFDQKVLINYSVFRESGWGESFDAYDESDVDADPPHLPPIYDATEYCSVTYENLDTKDNKILKYFANEKKQVGLKMYGEGGSTISGKYSVSFRFKTPNASVPTHVFRVDGYDGSASKIFLECAITGTSVYVQDWVNGSNTRKYILNKTMVKDTWYKITFNFDTATDTYTYQLNDGAESEPIHVRYQGNYPFKQIIFGRTDSSSTAEATIYLDDIWVKQSLTPTTPVNETITVCRGESVTLPEAAATLLSDGKTVDYVPVTWSQDAVDTSTVGTKTITGTIAGCSEQAVLTVNVTPFSYEIVSPILKLSNEIILGLKNGASLAAVTVKQISRNPQPGRLYAAVYNEKGALLDISYASLPTTWSRDEVKEIAIPLAMNFGNDVNIDTCKLKVFALSNELVPYAASYEFSNSSNVPSAATIHIAGDSTACIKTDTQRPEHGWDEKLTTLCEGTAITVNNQAMGSRSSKSFYDEGRLATILQAAKVGDYLFIQFGHNDANKSAPATYADYNPGGVFEQYMAKYVNEARAKGVIPVILTPICRGTYSKTSSSTTGDGYKFTGDGASYANGLHAYAAAAKRVASQYNVPLIDLLSLTYDFFKVKTRTEGLSYFDWDFDIEAQYIAEGKTLSHNHLDYTHLNEKGAELVAGMIRDEMARLKMPIANLLTE